MVQVAGSVFAYPAADFKNLEATNRISTNGGTWTVDRLGYIVFVVSGTTSDNAYATIDDVQVGGIYISASTYGVYGHALVYPGQVVKLKSPGSITPSCRYAPIKWIGAGV
jgi:hypothetical protein